jgi:RNA polymerase sigma-70 factor (ECF subfamily)
MNASLGSRRTGQLADNVRQLGTGAKLDDATLVSRACQGERWAEEALYQRHVAYIMGMVVRLLGNRTEAEDVVQDTFLIGLDRLDTVRRPEAIRGWLAMIAVREVRRRLRRARLLARLGFHSPKEGVDFESLAGQEADTETRVELAAIGDAVAKLPADERLAWMLRYVEGEPLEEVARLCGCSLATAKRRIAAAVSVVNRHIGPTERLS